MWFLWLVLFLIVVWYFRQPQRAYRMGRALRHVLDRILPKQQSRTSTDGAFKATNQTVIHSPPAAAALEPKHTWPELGHYDFEVVGESKYQHVLRAFSDASKSNEQTTGTAILVPEDDNPYDNKAVKVTLQGLTIGYLSREDARSYRRRLASKKLGMVPASCGVLVTGGHVLKDGSRAHYGAQLDMKPFDN